MEEKPQTRRQAEPADTVSAFADLQKTGFENLMGFGAAWSEAMSEISAEFATFLAERIREDVRTQHKILHCKDVGELQSIQAAFLQTAIDQYQSETGKLLEMSSTAFTVALKGPGKG